MALKKELIIQSLETYHDSLFTPGVYEHSIFGQAALLLKRDAVEVVRCGACKYFMPKADGTVGFCKCGEVCGYCPSMRVAYDFCSYGERKDDHGK